MSADICPKCDEQSVRNEECFMCGWSAFGNNDLKELREQLEEALEELKFAEEIIRMAASTVADLRGSSYPYMASQAQEWLDRHLKRTEKV